MIAFVFILQRPVPQMDDGIQGPTAAPKPQTSPRRLGARTASRVGLGSTVSLNQAEEDSELGGFPPRVAPGPEPPGMPELAQRLVLFTMFAVYALTYALPSLGPYMVQDYVSAADIHPVGGNATGTGGHLAKDTCSKCDRDDLLRYMNLLQQIGDVAGRAATTLPWVPSTVPLVILAVLVFGISGLFIAATVLSSEMVSPPSQSTRLFV